MIETVDIADAVIQKYTKNDKNPVPFARFIVGIELRPIQLAWFYLILKHPSVVGTSAPRIGKSLAVAFTILYLMCKYPKQDVRIFAPRFEQAKEAHTYIYEWVQKSPALKAFVAKAASGKPILDMSKIQLRNRSNTKLFGMDSKREGTNATIMWLNEYDWFPPDVIPLIMDRGMGKNENEQPTRYILDGTIEGIGNITTALDDPDWFTLPMLDVYQGLALGYLDEESVKKTRAKTPDDEWLRKYCLIPTEARNFIWESKLRLAQFVGLHWKLPTYEVIPGLRYDKQAGEKIAFGLDMGAQGSGDDASEYALNVHGMVGRYRRWLYSKTWEPTEDPGVIINEIADIWSFFRPDGGYGDSLDANLVAQINEELYARGLIDYDWKMFGDNSAGAWREWREFGLLTPLVNSGPTKHHMYTSYQKAIHNVSYMGHDDFTGNVMVFPQVQPHLDDEQNLLLARNIRELANLGYEKTAAGYYKISRIKMKINDEKLNMKGIVKLGDDLPDAGAMANYFLDFLQSQEPKGELDLSVSVRDRVA